MKTSPLRHVKRTKKRYRCSWCWEIIKQGDSCNTCFTYDENVNVWVNRVGTVDLPL